MLLILKSWSLKNIYKAFTSLLYGFNLFFFFPSCSFFYHRILLFSLCYISTFPLWTNRLSDATSSVKWYLSHADVHFKEIWSHIKHINTFQQQWLSSPSAPHFSVPHFTALSLIRRTLSAIIWNLPSDTERSSFLITLFWGTVNHALPMAY